MLPVDGSVCCYQLYTEVYLIKTKVGSATSHIMIKVFEATECTSSNGIR